MGRRKGVKGPPFFFSARFVGTLALWFLRGGVNDGPPTKWATNRFLAVGGREAIIPFQQVEKGVLVNA